MKGLEFNPESCPEASEPVADVDALPILVIRSAIWAAAVDKALYEFNDSISGEEDLVVITSASEFMDDRLVLWAESMNRIFHELDSRVIGLDVLGEEGSCVFNAYDLVRRTSSRMKYNVISTSYKKNKSKINTGCLFALREAVLCAKSHPEMCFSDDERSIMCVLRSSIHR